MANKATDVQAREDEMPQEMLHPAESADGQSGAAGGRVRWSDVSGWINWPPTPTGYAS